MAYIVVACIGMAYTVMAYTAFNHTHQHDEDYHVELELDLKFLAVVPRELARNHLELRVQGSPNRPEHRHVLAEEPVAHHGQDTEADEKTDEEVQHKVESARKSCPQYLYSYPLYSYGLYGYGLYSYGLYSCGLRTICRHGCC